MDAIKKVTGFISDVFGMIMGEGVNGTADLYLSRSPYLRTYFG